MPKTAVAGPEDNNGKPHRGASMEKKDRVGANTNGVFLLFLLFLGLKLGGAIQWSWWWVFAPLWAPIALAVCAIILGYVCACVAFKLRGKGIK